VPQERNINAYDARPWLKLYASGVPHEIEPEHRTMLAAFAQTAARYPREPALHYFDTAISYRALDEITDSLAAALCAAGFQRGERLAV
jgi:long-chain acyl-CoA synthetase